MLPDYPETKRLFERFFQTYMRRKARQVSPFLSAVQVRYIHEGRGMKITRADDTESESKVQQLSAIMQIGFAEIEHLTFEKVIQKFDELVVDMVRKQAGFAMERISEDLPASQTVDAKGEPLTPQVMYDLFERIELEYNPDGTIQPLHVVGQLFTPEKMKAMKEQIEADPEMNKKFDDLMRRKKETWLAREADRKLVG
jgi:hypothetical protein